MRLFQWADDGGPHSGSRAFFFVEIKPLFTVALLRFTPTRREAFHSHAFNACTWVLSGSFIEHFPFTRNVKYWVPSLRPKITKRSHMHKTRAIHCTLLTLRGPWARTWQEYKEGTGYITLTNGRQVVA